MSVKLSIPLLAGMVFTISPVSNVMSGPALLLAGEPSAGVPACEEFYDKWEVPGMSASMFAMFGLAREVAAANDCIDKGNVPVACKHWQGLLAVMDKMGPPLDESRGDVEKLMSEHKCEEAASSPEPNPEPAQ